MATTSTVAPPDPPEVRKYNRIKRWLEIGDFVLGFGLLLVLLLFCACYCIRHGCITTTTRLSSSSCCCKFLCRCFKLFLELW